MGDGSVTNTQSVAQPQSVQMQARWIAAMMSQDDAQGPAATAAPSTVDHTATNPRGNANPSVNIAQAQAGAQPAVKGAVSPGATQRTGGAALTPPPELFKNARNEVVVNDGSADGKPYLGMTIIAKDDGTYVDKAGKPIDLAAEEAKRGIGVPADAPATADPAAGQPAVDPNTPMLDHTHVNAKGQPQIVFPDGKPYLGKELYADETAPPEKQIVDKTGKVVDPNSLGLGPQGASAADQKMAKNIQRISAVGMGGLNIYMNRVWYNSTQAGMANRLSSLQNASKRFNAGTSLQSKMKDTPVIGSYVNRLQNKRGTKIDGLKRSISLQSMTPAQEAKFMAKENLTQLIAKSKSFKAGEGMMGRLKNAPVVGNMVKKGEVNRQIQIRQLRTQIKTGNIETSNWTKIKNASRGRVMPALMALGSGWSTYTEARDSYRRWDDPTNVRKWDDVARITGGAIQTGGALAALKRGNVSGAIWTATAGTVISTVGEFFRD